MPVASPRASARRLFNVPEYVDATSIDDLRERIRQMAQMINLILDGKTNAIGTATLNTSGTTTDISDARVGTDSNVFIAPSNATAAGETGAYVSATTEGQFTITHVENAAARTYNYVVCG